MFERFTDRARRVVVLAQEEARMLNHAHVGTEHILLGLVHEGEGIAAKVLESLGIALETVRQQVEEAAPQGEDSPMGHIPFTPRAKKVFELSLRESLQLGHNHIGTEHLLLGLIRERQGIAAQVLVKLGADLNRVLEQIWELVPIPDETAQKSASPSVLDEFGRNLTALAMAGRLPPVIGRAKEIEQVMQVLSRRTKNSPVLVGEPGVNKLEVAVGLAQTMARDPVPDRLKGKLLYALDLGRIKTTEQVKQVLTEMFGRQDILVVIDEIHTVIGAENVLKAAAEIKRELARGQLQAIGATTVEEYQRYIERDPALDRHFQPIQVDEPSLPHTIEILKGERDRLEAHHRVTITDPALVAAATLARQYISDRPLPESALDLLDAAGAAEKIRRIGAPPDLSDFDEQIAEVRREKETAIEAQDFEQASRLREDEKALLGQKSKREKEWRSGDDFEIIEVDEDLIVEIVAARTGIPAGRIRDARSPEPRDVGPEPDVEQTYRMLNDQPIVDPEEDLLGTNAAARGIADILTRAASPFVLAVDGSWGMGKSTLLRQIEAALPGRQDMVKVRFNAWTAQGENALDALIRSVIGELDASVLRRSIRRLAKRRRMLGIARVGSAIAARFLGVSRLVEELWNRLQVSSQSRNEFRTQIQAILSEWIKGSRDGGRRTLVVFIDDLDRCSDDVVVKICEAVKLYLDAPGMIFVIGCDLSVLARGVSQFARGGESEGRAYLEKIVQVAHRVPIPDRARITRLIHSYAKQAGVDGLVDATVTEILSEKTGGNPRRIKRIINSFVLEQHLSPAWRRPPLGSGRLIIVIILQYLYPAFYDRLVSEDSGEDPIGAFLDYADVRARMEDPPSANDTWWAIAGRVFRSHGMLSPSRSPAARDELIVGLNRIEGAMPDYFPKLAANPNFVALLREVGDEETRLVLRAQLISRPLGSGALIDAGNDLESA